MARQREHQVFKVDYPEIKHELITHGRIIATNGTSVDVKHMVWDTGATGSAIHPDVAKRLQLVPSGIADVQGDGGTREANLYSVTLGLPNNVLVTDGDCDDGTDVLVRMDVVTLGDFIVRNCNGKTHFAFRRSRTNWT